MLGHLLENDLMMLSAGLEEKKVKSGETVIKEGDFDKEMFLLMSGEVIVRAQEDGEYREVHRITRTGFFGERTLLTGEPRCATCKAVTDSILLKKSKVRENVNASILINCIKHTICSSCA